MNKRYTKAFREQAMKLVTEQEYGVATAARQLGIPAATLGQWLAKAGWRRPAELTQPPPPDDPKALAAGYLELQRQVRRLEMENEILKKATAYFASQNLPASNGSTGIERSTR
jgi:transposase